MKLNVCEVMANVEYIDEKTKKKTISRELVPINEKGCNEIEVELVDINVFTANNKNLRLISLGKNNLYKLTLKSYKELKKELNKRGLIFRYV